MKSFFFCFLALSSFSLFASGTERMQRRVNALLSEYLSQEYHRSADSRRVAFTEAFTSKFQIERLKDSEFFRQSWLQHLFSSPKLCYFFMLDWIFTKTFTSHASTQILAQGCHLMGKLTPVKMNFSDYEQGLRDLKRASKDLEVPDSWLEEAKTLNIPLTPLTLSPPTFTPFPSHWSAEEQAIYLLFYSVISKKFAVILACSNELGDREIQFGIRNFQRYVQGLFAYCRPLSEYAKQQPII